VFKIFTIMLSFFMASAVWAGTKITVLQGESPGSIAHEFINTVVTELKTKYDTVEVINAGNCTKAVEIYHKFKGENLLFVFYGDHWLSNELDKHNCGVPITQTNLVFLTSQAQVICTRGNANADLGSFKNGKTFGFPFPHDFWTEVVKDINKNIGSNLQPVPYTTGGKVTTGLLSGEIDWIATAESRVVPMVQEGRMSCLAKMGDSDRHFPGIKTMIPKGKFVDFQFMYTAVIKNGSADQLHKDFSAMLKSGAPLKTQLDSGYFQTNTGTRKDLWKEYLQRREIFRNIYGQ
jgi:hypothetical protein